MLLFRKDRRSLPDIGWPKVVAGVNLVNSKLLSMLRRRPGDCRMCGQCVLSSTGMSCPMNCPKNLRNGPCGGVRSDGYCEVIPDMKCVWHEAVAGSARIPGGAEALYTVQPAIDRRLQGRSSWLRVARLRAGEPG